MIDLEKSCTKYAVYEVFNTDDFEYEKLLYIYDDFEDAKVVVLSFVTNKRRMKIREFVAEICDEE
tara:strand:- start:487 stop:681 length:195 start_codon:yes stop_codon:yes gene_type:complete